MPTDNLAEAIQLIEQGRHEQAQPILQALIQANPQDLTSWSWFVRSCRTPEKRLKALELCLKFNPGNVQILEAIEKLRGKIPPPAPVPAPPSTPVFDPYAYSSFETPKADPFAYDGFPNSNPEPYPYAAVAAQFIGNDTNALNAPLKMIGLDESPGRPFIWYDVWLKALTKPTVDSYIELLRDPLASTGRACWWVFLAGIVTGLFVLINLSLNPDFTQAIDGLEQQQNFGNFGAIIAVGMILLVPLQAAFSVLGLMMGAAIYDFLAKLFGGSGSFSRTAYLMGAYSAPFGIITSLLSLVPLVGECLNFLLIFYAFRLGVTSLQAAHRLNGGRATIIFLLPSLLILMLLCILLVALGPAFFEALSRYAR